VKLSPKVSAKWISGGRGVAGRGGGGRVIFHDPKALQPYLFLGPEFATPAEG